MHSVNSIPLSLTPFHHSDFSLAKEVDAAALAYDHGFPPLARPSCCARVYCAASSSAQIWSMSDFGCDGCVWFHQSLGSSFEGLLLLVVTPVAAPQLLW
tara:strand:+ start:218 stop:514 length:297 start_codon:yes stop_codon:yes gene_type:complete